jgi:hypothetical protein
MPGALSDIRVIEFAGIGAAPFGAMMLADAGARAGFFLSRPSLHVRVDHVPLGR